MLEYQRDDARQRILVVATDPITPDEIVAMIDRQAAEDTWSYAMIYDFRGANWFPTTDDLSRFVARARNLSASHGPRGRVALLVARDVAYGMGRMYSVLAESAGIDANVFRSHEEAEAWLGGGSSSAMV